jgi:hypothetical protein
MATAVNLMVTDRRPPHRFLHLWKHGLATGRSLTPRDSLNFDRSVANYPDISPKTKGPVGRSQTNRASGRWHVYCMVFTPLTHAKHIMQMTGKTK